MKDENIQFSPEGLGDKGEEHLPAGTAGIRCEYHAGLFGERYRNTEGISRKNNPAALIPGPPVFCLSS
jgi:hypothetical protein